MPPDRDARLFVDFFFAAGFLRLVEVAELLVRVAFFLVAVLETFFLRTFFFATSLPVESLGEPLAEFSLKDERCPSICDVRMFGLSEFCCSC